MSRYMDHVRNEIDALSGGDSWFLVFGPRETIRQNMERAHVKVTVGQAEKLWEAYYIAVVDKGIEPYSGTTGAGALVTFMAQHTGYPVGTVAAYLNALLEAVKYQGWDSKWLNPKMGVEQGKSMTLGEGVADKAKQLGETVGNFLKPTLDPVTNLVKYTAVAVVAGAVIYGIYHGTKLFKAARRRKG